MEKIYCKYERKNGQQFLSPTYYANEVDGWSSCYCVDDAEDALQFFLHYFGKPVSGNWSWDATDMYQTKSGRKELSRMLDAKLPELGNKDADEERRCCGAEEDEVSFKKCSCGHKIPDTLVMSASMGTSCPDCYDAMSN